MDLYIFPTQELKRQRGVDGIDGYIFDVFIDKAISEFVMDLTFVDELQKLLIIYYLMTYEGNMYFKYFKDIKVGYAKSIGSLISELKLQGIMPDDFVKLLPHTDKYDDIALVYKLYNNFLKSNRLYDKEDRYLLAMDKLEDYVKQYDRVIFMDFYDVTRIQKYLMDKVTPKVIWENEPLTTEINNLYVCEAWDRITEIYNLAQQIMIDAKQGLRCEDVAIVIREPMLYTDYLHKVFKKVGIPLAQDICEPLLRNPFVKGLIGAFRGIKNSYFEPIDVSSEHNKMEFHQWNEYVLKKLRDAGYPDRLIDINGDLQNYKRDIEAYNALESFLDRINKVFLNIRRQVTIDVEDYINKLKEFLKDVTYCREISNGGINIITPTRMRGLKFKKIYILGMVEGEYPRKFTKDWLIKEDHRRLLNEKGYSIDILDSLIKREKLTLSYIMSSSEEIYTSYPDILENNKPSLMSTYLSFMIEHSKTVCTMNVDLDDVFVSEADMDVPCIRGTITADLRPLFGDYIFSPTSLEKYIQCPYRFFLGEVLNIIPAQKEEFNSSMEGSVYHEVLCRFVTKHQHGFKEEDEAIYVLELEKILDEVLSTKGIDKLFESARIYQLMRRSMINILVNFLRSLIELWSNMGYFPYKMEYYFGYNGEFKISGVPFKGVIDRIDRSVDGKLVVYDYKRSVTPALDDVLNFENIQLPLYIMAAEEFLGETVGGAFVSIKKGTVDTILVKDPSLPFARKKRKGKFNQEDWNKFFEDFAQNIFEVYKDILANRFPLRPKRCPKKSAYGVFCEYADICVYDGKDDM